MQLPIVLLNKIQSYIGVIYCSDKEGLKDMLNIKQNIDEMFMEEKTIDVEYKHLLHLNINMSPLSGNFNTQKYLKKIPKSVTIIDIDMYLEYYDYISYFLRFQNIHGIAIFLPEENNYSDGEFYGLNNIYKFITLKELFLSDILDYKLLKNIQNLIELHTLTKKSPADRQELENISKLPKLKNLSVNIREYKNEFNLFNTLTNLDLINTNCTRNMLIDITNIIDLSVFVLKYCDFNFNDLLVLNNSKKIWDLCIIISNITDLNLSILSGLVNTRRLVLSIDNRGTYTENGLCELHKLKNLVKLVIFIPENIIQSLDNFKINFRKKIGHPIDIVIYCSK